MSDISIVYPCLFLMGHSLLLMLFMFLQRVRYIKSGKVDARFFKTYHDTKEVPKELLATARNYSNQFEVPVMFYALCIFHITLSKVTPIAVNLAWFFVLTRLLHSFIHISSNKIMYRLGSFTLGLLAIVALMVHLIL